MGRVKTAARPMDWSRARRLLLLFFFPLLLSSCAARYRPEEERQKFESFQEALYEGMPRGKMMKAAHRKPILVGIDIDDEHLTFQFRTPSEGSQQYYEYVNVVVDRATQTVTSWE